MGAIVELVLDRWSELPLGASETWDGPEGDPVKVTREEGPNGPFLTVVYLDGPSEGEERTFDDFDRCLDWLWGRI